MTAKSFAAQTADFVGPYNMYELCQFLFNKNEYSSYFMWYCLSLIQWLKVKISQ